MEQILNIVGTIALVVLGLVLVSPFLAGAVYITIHILQDIKKALRDEDD